MSVLHPNKENFKELLNSQGVLLVDFFATWCGPCKMLAPTIEDLDKMYENKATIAKIDIDENEELAMEYSVEAVPTVIIFKDGNQKKRITGVRDIEEYKKAINEQISN